MKRLLIAFILLTTINVHAVGFNSEPFFQFEIGTNIEQDYNIGYVDMLIGYRWRIGYFKLEIYGDMNNFHVWGNSFFDQGPFRIIYTVGIKLYFSNWYIKVEHFCSHAVYSNQHINSIDYGGTAAYWYDNRDRNTQNTVAAIGYKWN